MHARLAASLAPFALAAPAAAQYVPTVLATDRAGNRVYMLMSGPARLLRVHAEGPMLAAPSGMALRPDSSRDALVSGDSGVTRIDAETGAVLGLLVPAGLGGMVTPDDLGSVHRQRQVTFVLDASDGAVRRYAIENGAFTGLMVPALAPASAMVVTRGLFVEEFFFTIAYPGLNQVLRYDGPTGRLLGVVAQDIARPRAMLHQGGVGVFIAEDNPDPRSPDRILLYGEGGGFIRIAATLAPGETAHAIGEDYFGRYYLSVGNRIDQYDRDWQYQGSWPTVPGAEFTAFVPINASTCYADCDTTEPRHGPLDIWDFICFQYKFSRGFPYACNCSLDTGLDVCDIFDFLCFQDAYAAGCP